MNLLNYLKAQPFIVWNIGHENRVCVTYCNTRVNSSLLESVSQRFRRSARWKQAAAHTQCSSVSIVAARRWRRLPPPRSHIRGVHCASSCAAVYIVGRLQRRKPPVLVKCCCYCYYSRWRYCSKNAQWSWWTSTQPSMLSKLYDVFRTSELRTERVWGLSGRRVVVVHNSECRVLGKETQKFSLV